MRALFLIVACFTLAGCNGFNDVKAPGRRDLISIMDSAESIMNDNPERAYKLLDSIESGSIRSRALNARYSLLFTESQYKCYIPATSDSLIMTAVRYYSAGKHPELLFRSFYLLGCIYYELGQLTDAAVVLSQAEQMTDKVFDGYEIGLLYSQIGDVFFSEYDFRRAQDYYQMSYDCYKDVGKEEHMMHALYDIGRCQIELRDYTSAHLIMEEIEKWAETNKQYSLLSSSLLNQLSCSVHTNDLDKANDEIARYDSLFGTPKNSASAISKYAHYYILKADYKTAGQLIDNAWKVSNPSDSVNLLYLESLLLEGTGHNNAAIDCYRKSIEMQNDNIRTLLNQPVIGAQKDYYKSLSEIESIKASRNRNAVILLFSFLILLIIIYRTINHSRKVESELEKQGYLLTIKELRLKEDSKNEIINRLNNRVNTLFGKQYAELDVIFDKMIELDIAHPNDYFNNQLGEQAINQKYYKKLSLLHKNIRYRFEEIKSVKNQKKLDNIINDTYDNIMVALSDKKLKLSENDLLILRLLICGFSPKVVSYLTEENQKQIYQKRARILKRIEQKSIDTAKSLYKILKIKQL